MEGAELVVADCPLQIRHKDIGSRRDAFCTSAKFKTEVTPHWISNVQNKPLDR